MFEGGRVVSYNGKGQIGQRSVYGRSGGCVDKEKSVGGSGVDWSNGCM